MTIVVLTAGRSSLCYPIPAAADRQNVLRTRFCGKSVPAVRSMPVSATPSLSPVSTIATTANRTGEIDMRNPFIPSRSRICNWVETALIFGVAAMGLIAVVVATYRQLTGAF